MTKTIDNNLEESRWLKKINKTAKPFGERYLGIGFQEEGRKAKLKQLSADIVEKAKEVNTNKEYEELKEKLSDNEKIIVESEVPTTYDTTIENLKSAINGEHYEHSSMYPEFAKIAKEEGLHQIAIRLSAIAKAEKHHEERYIKLLKELEKETIFKKSKEKEWVCRECGYTHTGKEAPLKCPSCNHEQAFFQLRCEEY